MKYLIISISEKISVSMQKLVQILPQRNALHEFENSNNQNTNNYKYNITKATNNIETNQWGFLSVRFIVQSTAE